MQRRVAVRPLAPGRGVRCVYWGSYYADAEAGSWPRRGQQQRDFAARHRGAKQHLPPVVVDRSECRRVDRRCGKRICTKASANSVPTPRITVPVRAMTPSCPYDHWKRPVSSLPSLFTLVSTTPLKTTSPRLLTWISLAFTLALISLPPPGIGSPSRVTVMI